MNTPTVQEYERLLSFQAEVMHGLAVAIEVPQLLVGCVQAMVSQLSWFPAAHVWLVDPRDGWLDLQASAGADWEFAAVRRIPPGQFVMGRIVHSGMSQVIHSFGADQDAPDPEWLRKHAVVALVGCPMLVSGRVEGVLMAFSQHPLSPAVVGVLEKLSIAAGQAMVALRSRAAVQDSQERLLRVIEGSNDGYWDWHLSSGDVFYSLRFSDILGYQPSEMPSTTRGWTQLLHPEDAQAARAKLDDCLRGDEPSLEWECRLRDSSGCWKWVLIRAKVSSWSAPSKAEWLSGTLSDISQSKDIQQQLTESEAKFKTIFDNMLDGYFSAVFMGRSNLFNPAAIKLLGYQDAADLIHVSPEQIFVDPLEYQGINEALLRCGHVQSVRAKIRRKDGSLRLFEGSLKLNPVAANSAPTVEAIFRDVTEQAEDEERIRAGLAIEAANQIKNEFLAKMSHEIRTPLNALIGLAHLALQTALSERQSDYLEKIQRSGKNLLMIVNDILDFAKVEAGKLELEQVEMQLDEVLDNLIATFAGKAAEKGLEFLVSVSREVPDRLLGDPLRLGQVLINLVGNAVKFTSSGEVCLSIHVAESADDAESRLRLHFLVRDSGIGLSQEQIKGLFQAFSQADSSTARKYGGTGLGLAISDRLVRLMGGKIVVESGPDLGSTFSFTALFGRALPYQSQPMSVSDMATRRALIIEDHAQARGTLAGLLRSLSMEVCECGGGDEAITQIERARSPFDLVFLEQSLAGKLDAERWCQWLRSSPVAEMRTVPVILVAQEGQGELPDGQAVLFKPVTRTRLLQTLASLLHEPVQQTGARHPSVRPDWGGERVLLVEDHPINQQVARELLESAGLQVDVVGDGQQAVDCVLSTPVGYWQLVLMDLQMPRLDGYAATEIIRADARLKDLPIVAMTAHVLVEERQRCLAVGMNDFVAKPIDPQALFQTLRQWIPRAIYAPPSRPSSNPSFPAVPGIDVQAGLQRVAGNAGLYRALLMDFAHGQQHAAESLEAALNGRDAEQVRLLAHTLKGVAGNLGAEAVPQQAGQLEELAGSARLEAARPLLFSLRSCLSDLGQQIVQALTESPPQQAQRSSPPVPLDNLWEQLTEQLKNSDGAALDTWEVLSGQLQTSLPERLLKAVTDPLHQFDFEAALTALPALSLALPVQPGGAC